MIEIPVSLRQSDIFRAHLSALWRMTWVRLYVLVLLVFAAGGLLWGLTRLVRAGSSDIPLASVEGTLTLAALFSLLLLACLPVWLMARHARRHFLSMDESARLGVYRLSAEGFDWTLGSSPGKRRWDEVGAAELNRERVCLRERTHGSHWIPLRDLPRERVELLREELHEALGDRLRIG